MNDEQNADFDLGSAIEKIQEMMSNDEGQSKLNNIISAFAGNSADTEKNSEESNKTENNGGFPDFSQMDMMIKLGNMMSAMKSESGGKNAALLYAIKPYLRKSRQDKTDSAVKIMGMVRVLTVLKESGINFDL